MNKNDISKGQDKSPVMDAKAISSGVLDGVMLDVSVVLGETKMTISECLSLSKGAIINFNQRAGDLVSIHVNDRCIARGEILIVDDRVSVTIQEIVS